MGRLLKLSSASLVTFEGRPFCELSLTYVVVDRLLSDSKAVAVLFKFVV